MRKTKVVKSVFVTVFVVCISIYTTFAAVYIEDWGFRFEKNDNGSAYEINKYTGDESAVFIPKQYNGFPITSIGEYSFVDTSVSSVIFGDNIQVVENNAFINVSSLTVVGFNDNLMSIKSLAFAGCEGLNDLEIPAGVTEIADDAFLGCDNLIIYCYADSAAYEYAAKKGIPFVIISAAESTEPSTEPSAESEQYMLGDVDSDGEVTILDATVIQQVLAKYIVESFDEKAANVTGEGLSIVDVTLIQRYLAGIQIPYPVGEWFTYEL